MNRRLQLLQLRKEALTLRAEMERLEFARHLADLRRPSEVTYKGLHWLSLLRMPIAAIVAARLGGGADASLWSRAARYAGIAVAGWKFVRGTRELFKPARPPAS